jgi:hypothetical protein
MSLVSLIENHERVFYPAYRVCSLRRRLLPRRTWLPCIHPHAGCDRLRMLSSDSNEEFIIRRCFGLMLFRFFISTYFLVIYFRPCCSASFIRWFSHLLRRTATRPSGHEWWSTRLPVRASSVAIARSKSTAMTCGESRYAVLESGMFLFYLFIIYNSYFEIFFFEIFFCESDLLF